MEDKDYSNIDARDFCKSILDDIVFFIWLLIIWEFVQISFFDQYTCFFVDCGEGKKKSQIEPVLSRDRRDTFRVKRQETEMSDR